MRKNGANISRVPPHPRPLSHEGRGETGVAWSGDRPQRAEWHGAEAGHNSVVFRSAKERPFAERKATKLARYGKGPILANRCASRHIGVQFEALFENP